MLKLSESTEAVFICALLIILDRKSNHMQGSPIYHNIALLLQVHEESHPYFVCVCKNCLQTLIELHVLIDCCLKSITVVVHFASFMWIYCCRDTGSTHISNLSLHIATPTTRSTFCCHKLMVSHINQPLCIHIAMPLKHTKTLVLIYNLCLTQIIIQVSGTSG